MRVILFLTVCLLSACQWSAAPVSLKGAAFQVNTSKTDPILMQFHKTLQSYGAKTHAGSPAVLEYHYHTDTLALSASGQDRMERMTLEMNFTVNEKKHTAVVYHDRLVNQNQKLADEAEVELIKRELADKAIIKLVRLLNA